jgi:hypothetical protein
MEGLLLPSIEVHMVSEVRHMEICAAEEPKPFNV